MEEAKNKLNIYIIKTNSVCFITDCLATSGYDYEYHQSKIKGLFFDRKLPSPTFSRNWLQIEKYPNKIETYSSPPPINRRYELRDAELSSDKLPFVIPEKESGKYSESVLGLYKYCSDEQEKEYKKVECEIKIVMEVDNFELPPVFNYKTIRRDSWADKEFIIDNNSIDHQIFDKIIFPEIMLHTRPCSISSQKLYGITRQYIKDHMDTKVAKITSDYDFCFTVKKVIPLLEPQTYQTQNLFARTKRERTKINYVTQKYKEVDIFEMTHDQSKYNNYTVLGGIFADNERELKEKIDFFLEDLISVINEPLSICPCCKGTGYEDKGIIKWQKIVI